MKTKKTPDLKQAGTMSADEALAVIGDDPDTLILAIQLMDRILARRRIPAKPRRNRASGKIFTKHRLTS